MSPSKLTNEWYRRVWNECEPGAIDELMADDGVIEGLEETPGDKESFRRFRNAIHAIFTDISLETEDLVEEGNKVEGLSIARATHKDSGKLVVININFVAEWKNGQLVWGKNVVDYLGLIQQLGETETGGVTNVFNT